MKRQPHVVVLMEVNKKPCPHHAVFDVAKEMTEVDVEEIPGRRDHYVVIVTIPNPL